MTSRENSDTESKTDDSINQSISLDGNSPKVVIDGKKLDRNAFIEKDKINLKGKTLDVYYHLIQNPGYHGVREIQRSLDFSSAALAHYHLNRLIEANVISKSENGRYGVVADEAESKRLEEQVNIIGYWIPKVIYIAIILFTLGLVAAITYILGLIRSRIILAFSFIILVLSFYILRESFAIVDKLKLPVVNRLQKEEDRQRPLRIQDEGII